MNYLKINRLHSDILIFIKSGTFDEIDRNV